MLLRRSAKGFGNAVGRCAFPIVVLVTVVAVFWFTWDENNRSNAFTAALTAALTFVAMTQAWIYHKQWGVMHSQLEHMRDERRPWVSMRTARIVGEIEPNKVVTIRLTIHNHGSSPATFNRHFVASVNGVSDCRCKFALPHEDSIACLPPNAGDEISVAPLAISTEDHTAIANGSKKLVFGGHLAYQGLHDLKGETGFLLEWSKDDSAFYVVGGPEDNYMK